MTLERYEHLEESDQLRYVDGELNPDECERIEQHLAGCTPCRDAVDDLAAASDGLTAFLNQTDFAARPLTYRGAATGRSWAPWSVAAVLLALLGGVGLLRTAPQPAMVPEADALPAIPAVPPAPPAAATPRVMVVPPAPGASEGVVVLPSAPRPAPAPSGVGIGASGTVFTIEVTSWQSAGMLTLLFDDVDVFSYRNLEGGGSSSINTQRGSMLINTTAAATANHEVRIPRDIAGQIRIRVGGEVVGTILAPGPAQPFEAGHSIFIGLARRNPN